MHAKHGDSFYLCSECSYKATQKDGLKSHIERVHRGKKEECPLCHVKIKSLDQHKRYKHPQHYKIYACSKCPYRSQYKSKLQAHLNGWLSKFRVGKIWIEKFPQKTCFLSIYLVVYIFQSKNFQSHWDQIIIVKQRFLLKEMSILSTLTRSKSVSSLSH